jgi:hypothetical protein
MSIIHSKPYRIPRQLEEIPDKKSGVYSFYLRFPTDYEFGLSNNISLDVVAKNIVRKLNEFEHLLNNVSLYGTVQDNKLSNHLMKNYKAVLDSDHSLANREFESIFMELARNPSKMPMKETLRAIRTAFNFATPVYIGMTDRQSLRKRLQQHLSGSSQFSERLTENNLGWNDLLYRCVAVDRFYLESSAEVERMIQLIFKPALSLR